MLEFPIKSKKLKLLKFKTINVIMPKSTKNDVLTAHETTTDGQNYINNMNVECTSENEIKILQKKIQKDPVLKAQDDEFGNIFEWITEFMGDTHVWWFLLPNLTFNSVSQDDILSGKIKREQIPNKNFPRGKRVYDTDNAFFNGTHWNSQRGNTSYRFDPYDEFQPRGTNQFCQTYSMMHLLNALPTEKKMTCNPCSGDSNDFKRFYYYTNCALQFILEIAEHCKKYNLDLEYDTPSAPYLDDLINMIKYCLKYYRICINIIKFP